MSSILQKERYAPAAEAEVTEQTPRVTIPSDVWPAAALVIAIGLALRGQALLPLRQYPLDGPLFYLIALGLFLWAVTRWPSTARLRQISLPLPEAWSAPRSLIANAEYRVWLGVAAAMFSVLAYLGFAGNRFSTIGVTTWVIALGCFLLAVAEQPATGWRARVTDWLGTGSWSMRLTWVGVALLGITLIAVFYRTYRLAGVPAEMTSDHVETYLEVQDVLNGERPIYFLRNTGHEALKFYLTYVLLRFTPLTMSFLTLKVGTALFSILTVPLTYLLARELYGRKVGLLAAGLLAISQWHVAISRIGLRPVFTPAFVVPTLFFLFRAFKYNRRNDWLASGLVLGAGLHSYTSMRVVPLLLVGLVGMKVLFDLTPRLQRRLGSTEQVPSEAAGEASALTPRFWVNSVLGGIASFLVFLPLFRVMREDPELFWYRVLTRSSDLERQVQGDVWSVFWGNVKDALLMFNYRGDVVWVNTVPGDPVMNWVAGALFVLGVGYALWRFVEHADRRGIYLFLSLFVLLLPSILSLAFPRENPSLTRGGGAVVIAVILAALPLYVAAERLDWSFGQAGRWVAIALIAVLFVVAARSTYDWYFVQYDAQYRRSAWNTSEMGEVVRGFAESIGDMEHAYHVAYPHWADTRNIAVNAGDITWRNAILNTDQLQSHVNDPAPKLYLLHLSDEESLSALKSLFPDGRLTRYESETPEKDFLIYFVPGSLQ